MTNKEFYTVKVTSEVIHLTALEEEVSPGAVKQLCEQIPALARQLNLTKVLIDTLSIKTALNTSKRYTFATVVSHHLRGLTIAIVMHPPLFEPERFGEMVANNLGLQLREFTTFDEAYTWLDAVPVKSETSPTES